MHCEPIHRWHIVISGFTQSEGRYSGMTRLAQKLIGSCPGTRVELRKWSDDWNDVAEWIHLCRTNGSLPDIVISGYSYGGFSATLLAAELGRRGLAVRAMVLCDAVYRHRYFAGNWRSLVPWRKIRVPTNVEEVYVLRQSNPRFSMRRTGPWIQPAGHDVEPVSSLTKMNPEVVLTCDHEWADDALEFHELALKVSRCVEPL